MTDFLELLFQIVVEKIAQLGYLGIILGMAFESACIPIPSEIILPFGGYLVYRGDISFWGAVAAGTAGGTLGSFIAYMIGLLGGRPFVVKYGRYFFVSPKDLHKAEIWFSNHGDAAAFFSRLLPIVRTFISLPCGIAQMKLSKFLFYTCLGSIPWSIALTFAGYKLGQNWATVREWFHQVDMLIGFALTIALLVYLIKRNKNAGNFS